MFLGSFCEREQVEESISSFVGAESPSDPELYYSTVIADMTSIANMSKKSDTIRQFFIEIDKDPDLALDEMLKRAVAEIERMKECH